MGDTADTRDQARRIEELIGKLELSGDPAQVMAARQLVEALMDLHGAALERMLQTVSAMGAPGEEILRRFGVDDLVGSLLILYGIHPLDLETRVRRALDKLEPALQRSGGRVDLLGIEAGIVKLHVQSRPAGELRTVLEEAVYEAAPDVAGVQIEGLDEARSGFVPIEALAGARSR